MSREELSKLSIMKQAVVILVISIIDPANAFLLQEQNDYYIKQINKILFDLDSLITGSQYSNSKVLERHQFLSKKLRDKEIAIEFDDTSHAGILEGAEFRSYKNSTKPPSILLKKPLIDLYLSFSSLVFSEIIHESQHIYDYFNNRELFLIAKNNRLEKFYFEADAYCIETLFINEYLIKNNHPITPFEKYLSSNWDDGLYSAFLLFLQIDYRVVKDLQDLSDNVELPLDEAITGYKEIGEKLISKFSIPDSLDDWVNYVSMIEILTFKTIGPQIFLIFCIQENKFKTRKTFHGKIILIYCVLMKGLMGISHF